MTQTVVAVIFWVSLGLTLYVAVVSPCLLALLPRLRRQFDIRDTPGDGEDADLPSVSVIFPAFQDDGHLLDRLYNLLESDFPIDKLEIVVSSNRRDELICDLISTVNDPRVRTVHCDRPKNNIDLINASLTEIRHEVVLVTDANVRFDRDAILRLASRFRNPHIGGVCGTLLENNFDTLAATQENEYRFGIASGRTVAAYRAELLDAIPPSVQNFDRFAGLSVYRSGLEIVIEPDAVVQRRSGPSDCCKENRGVIGQTVGRLRGLWQELRTAGFSLATWAIGNRILRRIAPIFIVAAMMSNAILAGHPFYLRLLLLHELAYVMLLMYLCLRDTRFRPSRSRSTADTVGA